MHSYWIRFKSYHRTRRRFEMHLASATGRSRWSALRAWWRVQRQFQPNASVVDMWLDHRGCPRVQYPTDWEYTCPEARR